MISMAVAVLIGAAATCVFGQSSQPAIFVANNGNVVGAVASFHIIPDGSLVPVDYLLLGETSSAQNPCPGCNASTISITPDGRHLAVGHPSSDVHPVHVSIIRIDDDATMELVNLYQVPPQPLSVAWLSNDRLAITRASAFGFNDVRTYGFDENAETLTLIDAHATGGFTPHLTVDREHSLLFASRIFGGQAIISYSFGTDGTIDFIQALSTSPTDAHRPGLTPDGARLYAGGGATNNNNKIVAVDIDSVTGTMQTTPCSPFLSTGVAPRQVVVNAEGTIAVVGHGTDATVRTFTINQTTGGLTPTGHLFDVGTQGSLGDIAVMDNFVFFTDNTTVIDGVMGVYSFTLGPDGSLSQNGSIQSTGSFGPQAIAVWKPIAQPCPADLTSSGDVNVFDLLELLAAWGECRDREDCPADLNGDGAVNVFDLLELLSAWGSCP